MFMLFDKKKLLCVIALTSFSAMLIGMEGMAVDTASQTGQVAGQFSSLALGGKRFCR
jgi:hypothetical protein